jgi:uncharacterized alpha-E superfamily protein
MLARVAQTLFLVARDLERAETTARLLEVTQAMDLEAEHSTGEGGWVTLVRSTSDLEAFRASYGQVDESSVGWHLTLGDDNPDAITWLVARARERARSVRNRLPSEVWEALNALHLELGGWTPGRIARQGLYGFCELVRERIYLVLGLIDISMRRDDHWTFMRLGRFLERVTLTCRMLVARAAELGPIDPALGAPLELHRWSALLHAAQADEAYTSMNPGISAESVLRFLVLDDRFPRSVRFSLEAVAECLASLEDDLSLVKGSRPRQVTRQALEFVESASAGPLASDPADYLERIQRFSQEIADSIHVTCFAAGYVRPGSDLVVQAQGQSQN